MPVQLLDIGAPQSLQQSGWYREKGKKGEQEMGLEARAGAGRLEELPYLGSGS